MEEVEEEEGKIVDVEVGVQRIPAACCVDLFKQNPAVRADDLESDWSKDEEFSLHEAGRQSSCPSDMKFF